LTTEYRPQDLRGAESSLDPSPTFTDELVNYTYNNINELTQAGAQALTYDASGNLTQGYTPEGFPFTATYDSDNHLTGLSYNGNQITFSYLGHLLLKKTVNGVETRYVYDGFTIMQERDARNNLVNEYTYGLGLPGGIGGALQLNQGGALYSYLYDGRGNVTGLLDGVGNLVQTYQYDPFGVQMASSGSVNQPLRFSTKPYDEQTGLSYYGFRFYAPALGRWMTRDPIGERGGINLFEFVGNNPTNLIDPFGLVDVNTFPSRNGEERAYRSWFDSYNPPGVFSVAGHGDPNAIYDENMKPIPTEDLICRMKEKGYKGGPVLLASCATGKGGNSYAEKLANALREAGYDDASVKAPTDVISPGNPPNPRWPTFDSEPNWEIFPKLK